jgi:hypothetical protein
MLSLAYKPAKRGRPLTPVTFSPAQHQELVHLRDHHPKPYVRERAAALLKLEAGLAATQVAATGLLRKRKRDTVVEWLRRYQQAGAAGLLVRAGRGRRPAFSP